MSLNVRVVRMPLMALCKRMVCGTVAVTFATAMSSSVLAGNFSQTWGTAPYTWVPLSLGPNTYTLTDQHGFQLNVRYSITRANGASAGNFPDDLLTDGAGNTFGTVRSIWNVWNPNLTGGGIGGSTNTAVMEIFNGAALFPVNGLNFTASDIDAVDSNNASFTNDRCDHVTFTGNAGAGSAGNPTLVAVTATPTFLIGPGAGAGGSPALAANQVQCNFQVSTAVTSASSNANDNGTVRATYPNGTSVATVRYDESIHNVSGVTSVNALARGIGIWSSIAFTATNNTITLDKQTTSSPFSAAGNVLSYNYVVTNNGPLPINAGQNIQIQDSKIGLINCPAIPAAGIAVGGTHTCSASYTVVAADMTAALVTNTATAGVGTGAMPFASRLQSNMDIVTVPRANPRLLLSKDAVNPGPYAAGGVVTYRFRATNAGNVTLTNINVSDSSNGNGAAVTPASEVVAAIDDVAPVGDSTDGASNGIWDSLAPGDTVEFTASYKVVQRDVDWLQ